jgi:hypothetical protein
MSRPATVRCQGEDCERRLQVGQRGPVPRFCKSCQDRRWAARKYPPLTLAERMVTIEELARMSVPDLKEER